MSDEKGGGGGKGGGGEGGGGRGEDQKFYLTCATCILPSSFSSFSSSSIHPIVMSRPWYAKIRAEPPLPPPPPPQFDAPHFHHYAEKKWTNWKVAQAAKKPWEPLNLIWQGMEWKGDSVSEWCMEGRGGNWGGRDLPQKDFSFYFLSFIVQIVKLDPFLRKSGDFQN